MSKTMAEVLAEHLPIYKFSHTLGESAWACSTPRCEVEGEFSAVIDHQAAALSAAGFGPVQEARAEALREAAEAAEGMHDPVAPDCKEWADWLRARAMEESKNE